MWSLLLSLTSITYASEVYFETNDGCSFICQMSDLQCNMAQDGKLWAMMTRWTGDEGRNGTKGNPYRVYANGERIKSYILPYLQHGDVRFTNETDAWNTLLICQDWGYLKLEEHICKCYRWQTLKEQEENRRNPLGVFVSIPGGEFMMGSPPMEVNHRSDETQHKVTLSAFEMGETVVTQEIYAHYMGANPSRHQQKNHCPESFKKLSVKIDGKEIRVPVCAGYPVEHVSWDDAQKFIKVVNSRLASLGYTYSLPSEAQTEYIFRGGTATAYVSGEDSAQLADYVRYSANSLNEQTQPVKSLRPNRYGIYRGGVWEWTGDYYGNYQTSEESLDPIGPPMGTERVFRGGSLCSDTNVCRSAARGACVPDFNNSYFGFRLKRAKND
jgi:formylglycine-generating enzyme required for sulfatase activity